MRKQRATWLLLGLLGMILSGSGQVAAEPARAQTPSCVELVQNGGFESGSDVGWQEYSLLDNPLVSNYKPRTGELGAYLGGDDEADDKLSQTVTLLPVGANLALTAWWSLETDEDPYVRYDTLTISLLRSSDGSTLATLATLDNTAEENTWEKLAFDLTTYAGQSVTIRIAALTDFGGDSHFYLDDISLLACTAPVSLERRVYLPLILK